MSEECKGSAGKGDLAKGPFGGLIPDTVMGRVLAEIVADPLSSYSPKMLAELTDTSPAGAVRALRELEKSGFVRNISKDKQHPLFQVDHSSKRLAALTFLALAWVDDVEGGDAMDIAVKDYSRRNLGMRDKGNRYFIVSDLIIEGPEDVR